MITLALILCAVLLAAGYSIGARTRAGCPERKQPQTTPEHKPPAPDPIEPDARRRALNDIAYEDVQLSRLYELMDVAKLDLIAARRAVQVDADAERYGGGVVSGKAAAKHRAELDRALRKVIALEQRIHTLETAREKAARKVV